MKDIVFLGDSLKRLREFPEDARRDAGHQLREVQKGKEPTDWKPMATVGSGVREIRLRESSGAFRIIYVASLADRTVVPHAFQKKAQQTAQKDVDLAKDRLKSWKP